MNRNTLLTGIAVTSALGYGIALGLAKATKYAEGVEEDQYCRTPPWDPARSSTRRAPAPGAATGPRLPAATAVPTGRPGASAPAATSRAVLR